MPAVPGGAGVRTRAYQHLLFICHFSQLLFNVSSARERTSTYYVWVV